MEATHLAFTLSCVVIRLCPKRFPLTHHHSSGIGGFTWLPTLLWGCFRQEPLLQGRGASLSLVEMLDGSLVPSSGNNRCLFLLNNSVAHKVILKGWFVTVTTAVGVLNAWSAPKQVVILADLGGKLRWPIHTTSFKPEVPQCSLTTVGAKTWQLSSLIKRTSEQN